MLDKGYFYKKDQEIQKKIIKLGLNNYFNHCFFILFCFYFLIKTKVKIKEIVLSSSMGNQKNKDTLIEMVKLAYKLEGKGKNRKRQLNEILEIIEDKNLYFNFCLC